MAFPEDALAPHEQLVLNLHPHWWFIFKSIFMLVLAMIAGVFVKVWLDNSVINVGFGFFVLVALVWFIVRFCQWISTFFVLTSDRVIWREGVIAKRSIEIPLERINTVKYQQGIFERMLRLGDIEIESAAKEGEQRFEDIRRPSDVQKEIYIQMERNEHKSYDQMGQANVAAMQQANMMQPQPQPAAPSISDQINQLAQLRDAGHITPAEFEAKKAELLNRM